ncbi:MAG: hypothetical protein J6O51_04465 [Bacteroidales bacterium]|nr:hypothetical protein [Bacteroidales bacterium]
MKKLISILLTVGIATAALAQPQNDQKPKGGHHNFEKIKAEMVAFITSEVGLTAQEAEVFWPVFNKIEAEQKELMKSERKAYMALNKALAEGEGDVSTLLNAYLDAKSKNVNLQVLNAKEYNKILPVEKVAKFYTCEEKFRRQQIGRLQGRGGKGHGAPQGRNPKVEKSK